MVNINDNLYVFVTGKCVSKIYGTGYIIGTIEDLDTIAYQIKFDALKIPVIQTADAIKIVYDS